VIKGSRGEEHVNVNLKDNKMGHNSHLNPRDVGNSSKIVVRLKNWTCPISQETQCIEIVGLVGKISRGLLNEN
jgi:hypothetical protein